MFKQLQFESMDTDISIKVYEAFAIHVDFIKFPHYKKIQSKSLRTYLSLIILDIFVEEGRFYAQNPNKLRLDMPVFSGVFLAVKNIIN